MNALQGLISYSEILLRETNLRSVTQVTESCTLNIFREWEESEMVQGRKRLTMAMNYFLKSEYMTDVLIQMTQISESETKFLLPLARYSLQNDFIDPIPLYVFVINLHRAIYLQLGKQ